MKSLLGLTIAAATFCFPLAAAGAPEVSSRLRSCEDLKSEIAGKLDAKGVKVFTLTILTPEDAAKATGKVVGSCDGGAHRIVYQRG